MNALLVFLGGGLGALCRYAMGKIFSVGESGFPTPTFMANLVSCLLLGVILGLLLNREGGHRLSLFLATGFCGGFSTFSSFSAESLELIQEGSHMVAFAYILASLVICIGLILTGIKLGAFLSS